ncbi:MAG: hypothetical protein WA532_09835 [Candidatus Korobacteraceae bacterium]
MPVAYVIDASHSLVISSGTGVVTFQEIVSHQDRLLSDPLFSPEFDQLIDCRQATDISVTSAEARQIASRKLFSRSSRRAFLATKPFVFAIGRMMEAYNEFSAWPSKAEVFYDLASALEWLDRKDLSSSIAV